MGFMEFVEKWMAGLGDRVVSIDTLLKDISESNREIAKLLKDGWSKVDHTLPTPLADQALQPPTDLKRSLIREKAKDVVLALMRGDVRSDEAAGQIAEIAERVAPTITRAQITRARITIAVCRAFDVPPKLTNAKLEAAIDNVMEVINGRR